jgi:hypothetical protein
MLSASAQGASAERYFSIPGKAHPVSVDVKLIEDPENGVGAVYVGGKSILSVESPDYDVPKKMYRTQSRDDFEQAVSNQMLVPLPTSGNITDEAILQYLKYHEPTGVSR